MPTSGTRGVWSCGGGQSAVGSSRLPLRQPLAPGAREPASAVGSGVSGLKGRNRTEGRRTGRRRVVKLGTVRGRTGDIAHLERAQYFAFCSPCQALSLFLRLISLLACFPPHFPLRPSSALCSNLGVADSRRGPASRQCSIGAFASHPLENHGGSRAHATRPVPHSRLSSSVRRGANASSGSKTRTQTSCEALARATAGQCSFAGLQALSHSHPRSRQ